MLNIQGTFFAMRLIHNVRTLEKKHVECMTVGNIKFHINKRKIKKYGVR